MQVRVEFYPKDLVSKLAGFSRKIDEALRDAAWKTLEMAHDEVRKYPSPIAGSKYKRTGDLGRSLGKSMTGSKIGFPDIYQVTKAGRQHYKGEIGSNNSYASYVMGERQTRVHAGRWDTLDAWGKRIEKKVEAIYDRLLKIAIFKMGLSG